MKWITFFMTPYDTVKYTTSEIYPKKTTLSYRPPTYKFLTFLKDVVPMIHNYSDFKKQLHCFETIFMKTDGSWELIESGTNKEDFSQKELMDFSIKKEEKKEHGKKTLFDHADSILNKTVNMFEVNSKEITNAFRRKQD